AVVDDNHFVHELGHALENLFNPLLFIETGTDHCDSLASVQIAIVRTEAACRRLFSRPSRLMIEMMPKWFAALMLLGAVAVPLGADGAGLQQVQSVYLMPMGYGLDQYLANRLTAESVFQVVTDPKRADAVLTDNIGVGFERRLDDLFPRDVPPP